MLLLVAITGLSLALGRASGHPAHISTSSLLESQPAYLQSRVALTDGAPGSQEEGPVPQATPTTPAAGSTQYSVYTVQPGDTLNGIAEANGVTADSLIWNNPEIGSDPDSLIIGETLLVPGAEGVI